MDPKEENHGNVSYEKICVTYEITIEFEYEFEVEDKLIEVGVYEYYEFPKLRGRVEFPARRGCTRYCLVWAPIFYLGVNPGFKIDS